MAVEVVPYCGNVEVNAEPLALRAKDVAFEACPVAEEVVELDISSWLVVMPLLNVGDTI